MVVFFKDSLLDKTQASGQLQKGASKYETDLLGSTWLQHYHYLIAAHKRHFFFIQLHMNEYPWHQSPTWSHQYVTKNVGPCTPTALNE